MENRRKSRGKDKSEKGKSVRESLGVWDVLFSFTQCFILLIIGAIVLANSSFYVYERFYSASTFHAAGIIFVVMGVFRLVTLVMMCFGVFSSMEKGPAIALAVLILASLIMFFTGGVLMLVYHGNVKDEVVGTMKRYMAVYPSGNNDEASDRAISAWDSLQKSAKCCGIKGPDDWIKLQSRVNMAVAPQNTTAADEQALRGRQDDTPTQFPATCCPPQQSQDSPGLTDCSPANSYRHGCAAGLKPIMSLALGSGIFAILCSIIPMIAVALLILSLLAKEQLEEDSFAKLGSKIYRSGSRRAPQPVPTQEPSP